MNKSLYVIVDGSGSMNEMGKRVLQTWISLFHFVGFNLYFFTFTITIFRVYVGGRFFGKAPNK